MHLSYGHTTHADEEHWFGSNLFLLPWYTARMTGSLTYVVAKVRDRLTGKLHVLRLHGEVVNSLPYLDVNHRDADGLNNRRSNLRPCDDARNQQNTAGRGGSSRFKGMSWVRRKGKWRVAFLWEGKARLVGYYADEVEAALACD